MQAHDLDRLGSREQIAGVASRLSHGLAELATDIRDVIEAAIPALRDEAQTSLLTASIEQNVQTMLGILAHEIDPTRVDPPSAVEYARRLAQRGVSTFALIRAYRLGQTQFLHRVIEDLVQHGPGIDSAEGRATLDMSRRVAAYVDHVVEALIVTYAEARDEWLKPNAILRERIRSVLSQRELTLEAAQARVGTYRLRQHHLGMEVWLLDPPHQNVQPGQLRRAVDALAHAAGCSEQPLFVPLDESSVCVWLPLGTRNEIDRDLIVRALMDVPGTYVGLGEPAASLTGFRRTHEQGVSATMVARVNTPPLETLTPYADIAPIATLASDPESARAWVNETLGALAIDGEREAGLRETLRVFLAGGRSYAATAKALSLHRNTAQYRVRQAEHLRGRPLDDGRLDVELALLACRWLGPAVLRPAR